MSTEQANQFFMDYGPIIWFFLLTFAAIAVLVKAWPFITAVVNTVNIITTLPDNISYVKEKLDTLEIRLMSVEHEVKTNGGASLKDAVKRIEDRLDNI